MISKVFLRNFKCFRRARIPLAKLTILAGLNGMGKSSVIQALLLLRQSSVAGANPVRLRLAGELVDLGRGKDVFFEAADEDELGLDVEFTSDGGDRIRYLNRYPYDRKADSLEAIRKVPARRVQKFDDTSRSWKPLSPIQRIDILPRSRNPLFRARGFQYLAAERLGPRKTLPLSSDAMRSRGLGSQGEYVLQYLLEYGDSALEDSDPRVKAPGSGLTVNDQVVAWLQDTSPGARLSIGEIEAADIAVARYSFSRRGDVETMGMRPTNVGFGLSYVLPVLVALLGAKAGELVIIENPEAHIHPRGQTMLGQLAARAACAGVQVIVETHSDHLVDGLRIDVRNGVIPAASTCLHFFEREGSEAIVRTPTLGDDGRLSDWPAGFFDQHDENLLALLARPRT